MGVGAVPGTAGAGGRRGRGTQVPLCPHGALMGFDRHPGEVCVIIVCVLCRVALWIKEEKVHIVMLVDLRPEPKAFAQFRVSWHLGRQGPCSSCPCRGEMGGRLWHP